MVAGGVYGMFEFGRYSAGYDVVAALKQRTALRDEIEASEATISELRAKVAQLESSTVGQTREREEVQRTIGESAGPGRPRQPGIGLFPGDRHPKCELCRGKNPAGAYGGHGDGKQISHPRDPGPAHEAGYGGQRCRRFVRRW